MACASRGPFPFMTLTLGSGMCRARIVLWSSYPSISGPGVRRLAEGSPQLHVNGMARASRGPFPFMTLTLGSGMSRARIVLWSSCPFGELQRCETRVTDIWSARDAVTRELVRPWSPAFQNSLTLVTRVSRKPDPGLV
jgi:hypothetical protein